ncbi:unnamed protein product [Darwinula stevensoni]|uniref:ADAM 17-like protease n=1 Tax=Darwinula stevensoni TaxID=69355 RepID=A0A7R9AFL0_9CRUS|nr:unnamed protein product [Darwinula stevensoni]CAG0903094.1 unnamed protein product [Darwinula stevensoni]
MVNLESFGISSCSLQTILVILFIFMASTVQAGLNLRGLRYSEILKKSDLNHKIVKRGVNPSPHPFNSIKELSFDTHGKNFRLMLSPKSGILDPFFEATIINKDGLESYIPVDKESFFEGHVFGEKTSHVSAHFDGELLTATIETHDETYHVEPLWRHAQDEGRDSMLVYRSSDVKYSWAGLMEDEMTEEEMIQELVRVKREDGRDGYSLQKSLCPLLLVADYRFFGSMGASDGKTTTNYLISLIDHVHKIYEGTQWTGSPDQEGFHGMGFVIKKILIHSEPTPTYQDEEHYNMKTTTWDVRKLLEVFSRQYSHKNYCLAHLFTDTSFEGGILGLAYVGSPRRNSVGGICTPEYLKDGTTLYLNSGLSSSRNHYGQRLITREAALVTAHEFGHNWGSEHDPDLPECSPRASAGGSYIMYTYSVSGFDINNQKFSPCSLRSIRAVILAKSDKCFTEPKQSFCGNSRIEEGEECDAGVLGTEDTDACCNNKCKLRKDKGALCSDKNFPCCQNCQFIPKGTKCRERQLLTCEQEAWCTGQMPECPDSLPLADYTPCLEKGKCFNGKCEPFCESQQPSLQSCMCDTLKDACRRCCRTHINDTCHPVDAHDILPDGTPCFVGYCRKGKCEKTVQDLVERFWDIIEDIDIDQVLKFLRDNIVGTVIGISLFMWIPASVIISCVDRKRRHRVKEMAKLQESQELMQRRSRPRAIELRNRRFPSQGMAWTSTPL